MNFHLQENQRILALDVIRGFALLGIFLMNVEFFNRPLVELSDGLPAHLSGADWWTAWLIYNFVQGKFWTMFSLLFGMGFAVMLRRAERAGQHFLWPYLRRIAALGVFGLVHHLFIWGGDILFSYAVAAAALLMMYYGHWRYITIALMVLFGASWIPGMGQLADVAASFAIFAAAALLLRSEAVLKIARYHLPVMSLVFFIVGIMMVLVVTVPWLFVHDSREPPWSALVMVVVTCMIGLLSARWRQPIQSRLCALGVGMYVIPFLVLTAFGAIEYFKAMPAIEYRVESAAQHDVAKTSASAGRSADKKVQRMQGALVHRQQARQETQILTRGSYSDAVKWRARDFVQNVSDEPGFAIVVVGMFLIGIWFVRSGVIEHAAVHLPLFRRLAWLGISFGCGLGLIGSAIASAATPELPADPFQFASGLMAIGNLPACLGYVALLVLLLHGGRAPSRLRLLAPAGRMALTNYLSQSVLGTLFFYGYGLGHWGMGRAEQVLFVVIVFTMQVIFSHCWLARFRYGPMEWLWRAFTYWQWPVMRRQQSIG